MGVTDVEKRERENDVGKAGVKFDVCEDYVDWGVGPQSWKLPTLRVRRYWRGKLCLRWIKDPRYEFQRVPPGV